MAGGDLRTGDSTTVLGHVLEPRVEWGEGQLDGSPRVAVHGVRRWVQGQCVGKLPGQMRSHPHVEDSPGPEGGDTSYGKGGGTGAVRNRGHREVCSAWSALHPTGMQAASRGRAAYGSDQRYLPEQDLPTRLVAYGSEHYCGSKLKVRRRRRLLGWCACPNGYTSQQAEHRARPPSDRAVKLLF